MAGERESLLVVSHRGPPGPGHEGGGGLVVTIGPGAARDDALWVAATADGHGEEEAGGGAGGLRWRPVPVAPGEHAAFYDVVANGTLWYCAHGLWDLPRRPRFDRHWHEAWGAYRRVNEAFADAVAEAAAPGATVLVQDYHLALVGRALAERRPDLSTSLFLHTPWCGPDDLAVLPDAVALELLAGMAGCGAVGFHSPRWAAAWEACCRAVLGAAPPTFVVPAATDADGVRAAAATPGCRAAAGRLEEALGDRQLIARVDRIELSKNVLRGFWAFDELLEAHPGWRDRVCFAASVYPSRQGLADYLAYGQEVAGLAAHLNAKWGSPGWTPILLDASDDRPGSVAALRRYDVLLVNPVRDGLNLVASEGPLVNERDGTVVLSTRAGAHDTLGPHVLGVNPFDVSATAEALHVALSRTPAERAAAAAGLRAAAAAATPLGWWDAQRAAARRPG